jgi:hypothetical protein
MNLANKKQYNLGTSLILKLEPSTWSQFLFGGGGGGILTNILTAVKTCCVSGVTNVTAFLSNCIAILHSYKKMRN